MVLSAHLVLKAVPNASVPHNAQSVLKDLWPKPAELFRFPNPMVFSTVPHALVLVPNAEEVLILVQLALTLSP